MLNLPESQTWVISDTHFNHANIIEYTGRPYKSVEEMNRALITHWQSNVQPDDYIIHCGDFFMGRSDAAEPILKQLPGKIIFIKGNHDKLVQKMNLQRYFAAYEEYLEIKVGADCAVLSHFPIEVWNNAHKGWWHLHGHSHGTSRKLGGRLDVGVDAFCKSHFGAPRRWKDVRNYFLSEARYEPNDHHGQREYDKRANP